jgi:hypothetical protein
VTERRFVPFNPWEPRPAPAPEIKPGVLVAAFDADGVRVTDWAPLRPDRTVTWGPNLTCTAVLVVLWDGTERHVSILLPRPYVLTSGQMTVTLPATPTRRLPWWHQRPS